MRSFHWRTAVGVIGVVASLFGTGCGSDESLVGGECAAGYTQCGDRCVPLATDPDNCGACGQACSLGVACVESVCGGNADASFEAGGDAGGDSGTAANGDAGVAADSEAAVTAEDEDAEADAAAGSDAADATLQGDGAASEGGAENDATLGADAELSAEGGETDGSSATDGTIASDGSTEDATASDATPDEDAMADAETREAASCDGSLSSCGGGCVDTTSDPLNCGACNNVCASQFCQNAQCIGTTSGGLVFIGHDYDEASTGRTQSTVLSNAVFIPQANPLRVLEYDEYATAQALARIQSILQAVATNLGRTLQITQTSADAGGPSALSRQLYDVLLVPDQSTAPAGSLATVGTSWAPSLASFSQSGGIIVVLDGGTGTGEMPQFLTHAGLLDVTAQTALPQRTELDDVALGDVESVGLTTPYLSSGNFVSVTTEPDGPNVVYVIVTGGDAGNGEPVVIHKIL